MGKIDMRGKLVHLLPTQSLAFLDQLDQLAFFCGFCHGLLMAECTGLDRGQARPRSGGKQRVAGGTLQSRVEVFLMVILDGLLDALRARPQQSQQQSPQETGPCQDDVPAARWGVWGLIAHDFTQPLLSQNALLRRPVS
jgi:hypothetical protein